MVKIIQNVRPVLRSQLDISGKLYKKDKIDIPAIAVAFVLLFLIGLISTVAVNAACADDWIDESGWQYRKCVNLTGEVGAGTFYQVNLSIGDLSGGDFHLEGHCTDFPNDIVVTDNDGTTKLPFWIETPTVDPISMWVEVADSLDSSADVCVYYHNSGESSASNGENTFNLFDHFIGSSLNASKWDYTGTITVTNSEVILNEDDAILSKTKFGFGYVVYAKSKSDEQDTSFVNLRETTANSNNRLSLENSDGVSNDNFDEFSSVSTKAGADKRAENDNWDDFRNAYKTYTIKRISSSKIIFEQEAHSYTETSSINIPTVDLGAGLYVWDSSQASILVTDWIFIKKYNDPEPAFHSAGSEESAPGGDDIPDVTGTINPNEVGATWVRWDWDHTNVTIYVDGILQEDDYELEFFILTDLNPNERHRIDVVNLSGDGGNGTRHYWESKTHRSAVQVIMLFCFAFLLLLFGRWYCYISLLAVVWMSFVMREMITYEYAGMYIITSSFLMILSLAVFGEQFRKMYLRDGKLRLQ